MPTKEPDPTQVPQPLSKHALGNELIDDLYGLLEIERSVVKAYGDAIPLIDTPELADKFRALLHDHEQHMASLTSIIVNGGGPDVSEENQQDDIPINEHRVSIGDTLDTLRALQPIQEAESLSCEFYDRILSAEMPDEVRNLILDFRAHEQAHWAFVESALKSVTAAAGLWGPAKHPPILHH